MWMSAGCMPAAWCIAAMKKRIIITDFARMGGKARADKLSPERPRQIASEAGKKGGRLRQPKLDSGHRSLRRSSQKRRSVACLLPRLLSEDTMVTLCELRDRITEDQITQGEVIAALREPLAGTDDGYVRSKLKQAITSANIYYSSRKWGQCRTMERAKARLIADITKASA